MAKSNVDTLLKRKPKPVESEAVLSSGSTVLNLACSGKTKGAFAKGRYYYWVGDSSSGKSYFSMAILAEACLNPAFKNYWLVYNDVEYGMGFDVGKFFPVLKPRLDLVHSKSLEGMYDHLDDTQDAGPCIYIVDSMDALQPAAEIQKGKANKKARAKGTEEKGSYGTDKAKINSARLREATNKLAETGSILFIISQTRDNIGFGSQFNPKTRSGGTSLTFYATLELWTSVKENIAETILGKRRQLGILTKIKVKKNRQTGGQRIAEVPIYWSSGLDDVGGMVHFLVEEGHWKEDKGRVIDAIDFKLKMKREPLTQKIIADGLTKELRAIVVELWNRIEEACQVQRENRYAQ